MSRKIEIYVQFRENEENKIVKAFGERVDDNTAIYNMDTIKPMRKGSVKWFVIDIDSGLSITCNTHKQRAIYEYNNKYKETFNEYRKGTEYDMKKKEFQARIRKAKKE